MENLRKEKSVLRINSEVILCDFFHYFFLSYFGNFSYSAVNMGKLKFAVGKKRGDTEGGSKSIEK